MKKRFNGPLDYTKLSRNDIIDLILELKGENCIDVFYNVAYGLTDLIFGEDENTEKECIINTYDYDTIEKNCGKIIHKSSIFEIHDNKVVRLVKTEKFEKVWLIISK